MANFLFDFLKKNKRIVVVVLAFLTPIVACILFGLLQGTWIGNYYLPASGWNDEILYFKQIEGVVEHGIPRGYFGYDESCAQNLTFSAWSPIIMSLYVLWGKLFGWSYNAPILCNIFLICVGTAFFAWKAKLDYKQLGLWAGFVLLFTPLSRYMLSCMADCEIIFLLMIYMGLYVAAVQVESKDTKHLIGNIVGMLICSGVLTMMRPYFLLLFLFPGYLWFQRKKVAALPVAAVAGVSMVMYALVSQKFTAAYFYPLIKTEWIKTIMFSPLGGIKNAILDFLRGLANIGKECIDGIVTGSMEGALWCFFLVLLIVLICVSLREQKNWLWVLVMVAILGAIVMFYDIGVGSRHLIPFIVLGVMLLCHKQSNKWMLAILVTILILFTVRISSDDYNYRIPTYDEGRADAIATLQQQMDGQLVCEETEHYWDNTVIWLFYDETVVEWQNLFALPSGMGINLCMPDYVLNNLDDLKSKYIAVNVGERIDLLLQQTQATKVAEQDGFVIWQVRE